TRYISYGPDIKGSVGEIWPKPLWQNDTGRYYGIDPNNFQLVAVNKNCMLMQEALQRYSAIIRNSVHGYIRAPQTVVVGHIQQIQVNLTKKCETLPHLNMDESYFVWGDGRVIANSVWGILRGLETLSQLLVSMPNDILRIPETEIYDAPRFKYRGLMLDSARHFISKSKILQLLQGMEYNKLNVFHWHLADDSAFPFNSTVFPELSIKGAYRPEMTYSENDVRDIVEFARIRGIRGCSRIRYSCELRSLFPDEYLHLGVDEVQSFLVSKGLENVDLPYMYLERLTANMSTLGCKQMVWQEGMTENVWMEWPVGTIGQVWFNYKTNAPYLTSHNYDIIRSQDWYLYLLDSGGDWEKFYLIEPTDFEGTKKQKNHVLGGEACLWSEFINEHNVLSTTFPIVSAVAERLWSEKSHRDSDEATPRIEEHNCRMLFRGIDARPANSYGLC
ncbi:hypothetical protein FF38_14395, partial [Lucilia cuprina]